MTLMQDCLTGRVVLWHRITLAYLGSHQPFGRVQKNCNELRLLEQFNISARKS